MLILCFCEGLLNVSERLERLRFIPILYVFKLENKGLVMSVSVQQNCFFSNKKIKMNSFSDMQHLLEKVGV